MQSRPAAPLGCAWTWEVLPQVGTQAQSFSMKDKAGPGDGLIKKLPILFPHESEGAGYCPLWKLFLLPVLYFPLAGSPFPFLPTPVLHIPFQISFYPRAGFLLDIL